MAEISADDAGNAEQVLRRLVSERKALEAGYEVLRTYREVKSQLQPAAVQLQQLREQINTTNNELNTLIGEKERRLREVEESVALQRTRSLNMIQVDIDTARAQLAEVNSELRAAQLTLEDIEQSHQTRIAQHETELAAIQQQLLDARRQHSAIVEAVSSAAQMFRA